MEISRTQLVPQDVLLGWSSSCLDGGREREPQRQFSKAGAYTVLRESSVVCTGASRKALRKLVSESLPIRDCELLFRGSRDGFASQQFHSKCDNKGPTLVLVRSVEGAVFGGFASQPWDCRGGWINAPGSFLFSLEKPGAGVPVARALSCNNTGQAMLGEPSGGPHFGGGADLYLTNSCDSAGNSSGTCIFFGASEGVPQGSSLAAEGTNFMVADYEVWAVTLN